jgi:hypothetical protein
MSERNSEHDPIVVHDESITVTGDGDTWVSGRYYGDASDEAVIDHIAETRGVDRDDIFKAGSREARKRGFVGSLGLRWNSSWEPQGGNPNLN